MEIMLLSSGILPSIDNRVLICCHILVTDLVLSGYNKICTLDKSISALYLAIVKF